MDIYPEEGMYGIKLPRLYLSNTKIQQNYHKA